MNTKTTYEDRKVAVERILLCAILAYSEVSRI